MKIAVGCDHGGFEHKNAIVEHLTAEGFEVEDFGIYENKSAKTSWEYLFAAQA